MHAVPWHRILRKLPPEEMPLDQVLIGIFVRTAQEVLRTCSSGGRSLCGVAAAALVLLVCGPEFELFEACNFAGGSEGVGPTELCC